jgi:hypothetical protein
MPTAAEIREQINNLPHKYIFYTKREINFLPQIMTEGEEIRALTSGFADNRTVLAVVTNRRVLFLDKGMFFGLRQWQIALDRIQSIDGEYLVFFGSVRLWDGATATKIKMVLASTIDPFIKATRAAIDEYRRISFRETVGAASTALDTASQIERLARLKEQGHLTEQEFQDQKRKILASS